MEVNYIFLVSMYLHVWISMLILSPIFFHGSLKRPLLQLKEICGSELGARQNLIYVKVRRNLVESDIFCTCQWLEWQYEFKVKWYRPQNKCVGCKKLLEIVTRGCCPLIVQESYEMSWTNTKCQHRGRSISSGTRQLMPPKWLIWAKWCP